MEQKRNSKIEKVNSCVGLFEETLSQASSEGSEWAKFLSCSSRFYKYDLAEQIMIYAQRPNATACAPLPLWNDVFGRRISKGAKGIALLVKGPNRKTTSLRYVFDVADTWSKKNRGIKIWKFDEAEHTEVLREAFGDIGEFDGQATAKDIINNLVKSHMSNTDIDYISDDGAVIFAKSVSYIIQNRCGLNDDNLLINDPHYFDEIQALQREELEHIANEISASAQEILREIEKGVKSYEQLKHNTERGSDKNVRNQVQTGRGLFDTRPRSTTSATTDRQVRPDETGIHTGVSATPIPQFENEADVESISSGAERASARESKRTDRNDAEGRPSSVQDSTEPGVGTTYEQPQTPRGGDDVPGADLPGRKQLEPVDSLGQQDLFSSSVAAENPAFNFLDSAATASEAVLSNAEPSNDFTDEEIRDTTDNKIDARPITEDNLEHILLSHPISASLYDIYKLVTDKKQKSTEIEKALYKRYGGTTGGHSQAFNDKSGWFDYSRRGISLSYLSSDDSEGNKMSLSWSKVRSKYLELIHAGKYISEDEIAIREGHYTSDLPLINPEEIDSVFHLPYSEKEQAILLEILGSGQAFSDLSSYQQYLITAHSVNEYKLNRHRDTYRMTSDKEGILFDKKGHKLEFLTWEDVINHMRDLFSPEKLLVIDQHDQQQQEEESFIATEEDMTLVEDKEEKVLLDFTITNDAIGESSLQQRARNNLAAIRLIKTLEASNSHATATEQETLSLYTGWGSLSKVFDETVTSGWQHTVRDELQELLTPGEYRTARASTLTSFYTSPVVIRSMYDTLERLGFTKGNILEPAMGVGNFFGMLPEHLRSSSKLYGVELDEISGSIAKELYQNANISVCGFEKTDFSDNMFDVAVGNVPFGAFSVSDKTYDRNKFMIHDYFFAKTLDKVRPGGIVAFVTSKGTLDKANPQIRKYLAQRAELLGAVRLPNDTFAANAGTEVTSDIIFLQKRERQIDIVPEWVYTSKDQKGIPINQYFVDNPQMVLGTMVQEKSLYGNETETACLPIPGKDLRLSLEEALRDNIHGKISFYQEKTDTEGGEVVDSLPADTHVKNHSYTLVDNEVYFREDSIMTKVADVSPEKINRLKFLIEMRDFSREIIDLQLSTLDESDEQIKKAQHSLNDTYDRFTTRYGRINDKENEKVFEQDSSYYLLCSLEVLDENRNFVQKAPFFHKRTVRAFDIPVRVDSAADALSLSIAEKTKVDLEYMSQLTGLNSTELIADLKDLIYPDPALSTAEKFVYVTSAEYLSGNVRQKLAEAEWAEMALPGQYAANVEALEKSLPTPLNASEIAVRLGSTWVDSKYIKNFIDETIMPKSWAKVDVEYVPFDSSWTIHGKSADTNSNVRANFTYGTPRASAYSIIEDSLNLRDSRVYDLVADPVSGKDKRVVNAIETAKAQQKQEELKQLFKEWIFKNASRREQLVKKYNERYNSTRSREYDGSHLKFFGMNPDIQLKKHQTDGVARILYGPNSLLAHEVGAGKTFVMAAGMMESKRLGLCKKSMWVVPNHLTKQAASEFMALYPGANLLVATKKDFVAKNRKKFCARIATGEYDAVILGFSQFEKIPISEERQRRLIEEQIDELIDTTEKLKYTSGMRSTVKRMEKTRRALETRLQKLNDQSQKDDVVTFEELGVDKLVVDEAHNYKNLFFTTKMRNVAGLAQTEALKSSDLYMKCRYLDEIMKGNGILFATGTPISNSMTEMYTMMSYLQQKTLKNMQLNHFDAWAASFGETTVSVELAPEGTGYRAKTRFSKFFNLPELMTLFKTCADIKTADMLNLERPEANYHTVSVEPTSFQKELMQSLSERASMVHQKLVDSREDNMLKITTDGRKIGLDQRLYDPLLPDESGTKVHACADNVFEFWENYKEKSATQLVFCDFSTPSKKGKFNLYDDLREKLMKKGIPAEEIAFIHDADTERKKEILFAKVRAGQIRVLLGSTAKLGAGTNVQDKLIAIHDLDCPWRPSDLEQRTGRVLRQGNTHESVHIFRYVTKDTFDAYLYQTVENKQKFISQIMTSKSPVRSCEDVDESVLQYAEIKALCAGNPKIKEKMDLDVKVGKLQIAKSNYLSTHYALEDKMLNGLPQQVRLGIEEIEGLKKDIDCFQRHQPLALKTATEKDKDQSVFSSMTFADRICTTKEAAGNQILNIRNNVHSANEDTYIGEYCGFQMTMNYSTINKQFYLTLKNKDKTGMSHNISLGNDANGNITRIDNEFKRFEAQLEAVEFSVEEYKKELKDCEDTLKEPFAAEEELRSAMARLNVLNVELKIEPGIAPADLENRDAAEIDSMPNDVIAPNTAGQVKGVPFFSVEEEGDDRDDDYSR